MWITWVQEPPIQQTASGGNEAAGHLGAQKADGMPSGAVTIPHRLHSDSAQVTSNFTVLSSSRMIGFSSFALTLKQNTGT